MTVIFEIFPILIIFIVGIPIIIVCKHIVSNCENRETLEITPEITAEITPEIVHKKNMDINESLSDDEPPTYSQIYK